MEFNLERVQANVRAASTEDLLDRADARLFEAKQAGRDRIVGPPSSFRTAGAVPVSIGQMSATPGGRRAN